MLTGVTFVPGFLLLPVKVSGTKFVIIENCVMYVCENSIDLTAFWLLSQTQLGG